MSGPIFPLDLLVPNLQGLATDGVEDGQEARLIRILEPSAEATQTSTRANDMLDIFGL